MAAKVKLELVEAPAEPEIKFPELLKPDVACGVCELASTHPPILQQIHKLLRRGLSYPDVFYQMRAVYAAVGLPGFAEDVYDEHLRMHLDARVLVHRLRDSQSLDTVEAMEASSAEIAILLEMARDVQSLRERFVEGLQNADDVLQAGDVVAATALFREQREQLTARVKIKHSEQLSRRLVESVIETVLKTAIAPMGDQYRQTVQTIDASGSPEAARAFREFWAGVKKSLKDACDEAGKVHLRD